MGFVHNPPGPKGRWKNMSETVHVVHPFPPLYDAESKILILGSFPSVKSREQMFFYGHPQNRFWKVISVIYDEAVPQTIEEKKMLLLKHHIALWDVIASCDIVGSSDASIRNAVANDLKIILETADIQKIIVNGKTAEKYYIKYTADQTKRQAICLPSPSPANAAWSLEKLIKAWKDVMTAEEMTPDPERWKTEHK